MTRASLKKGAKVELIAFLKDNLSIEIKIDGWNNTFDIFIKIDDETICSDYVSLSSLQRD